MDSPHPIINPEYSSPTQSSPWAEQEVSQSVEQEVSSSAEQEVSQSNLQRSILPSPEPGEESSGSPLFNLKKFQTPTQCRSRNSITYTRDMFLKKVVDPEKKEERQRKKNKKK